MAVSPFTKKYTNYLIKYKELVILVWIILFILGLIFGFRLFDATTADLSAPEGSLAYEASIELAKRFSSSSTSSSDSGGDSSDATTSSGILLLVTVKDGYDKVPENSQLKDMFIALVDDIYNEYDTTFLTSVESYYSLLSFPLFSEKFVSDDKKSTYLYVLFDNSDIDNKMSFLSYFSEKPGDFIDEYELNDQVTYGVTGIAYFEDDITDGVKENLEMMDKIVLPIALLILGTMVRSLPLIAVTLIAILTTLLTEFLLMYPIALVSEVASFAPSIMVSLTIAMSLDYSLFLLSRFTEELQKNATIEKAVLIMLESAGHTILVSGSTLCCCFLGMLFLSMQLLRSVGIGSSIAILMALLVNLSLLPAILLTFGKYLLKCAAYCPVEKIFGDKEVDQNTGTLLVHDVSEHEVTPLLGTEISKYDEVESVAHTNDDDNNKIFQSYWYRLGVVLLDKWKGFFILCIVLVFVSPICQYCFDIHRSINFNMVVPHSSDHYKTFEKASEAFSAGALSPFQVLIVAPESDSQIIFTQKGFNDIFFMIDSIIENVPNTKLEHFTGMMTINGSYINYTDYLTAYDKGSSEYNSSYYTTLRVLKEEFFQLNNESTFFEVQLDIDPYSEDGTKWLKRTRNELDDLKTLTGYSFYLAGGSCDTYDAVQGVYNSFPTMIAITLVIVFVLIGLAFRSLIAPIRSVGSICFTLAFCYGLAVLVYQDGAFSFLHLDCFSNTKYVDWLPPLMCFSIIVGLSLDYDVFLTSRIIEFRLYGYSDRESTLKGLYKTGHIITAAGLIMAVAFSGLFMSNEYLLNQVGFLLVFSVLLDTFVARTVIVPILIGFTSNYTWWPRKLPPIRGYRE